MHLLGARVLTRDLSHTDPLQEEPVRLLRVGGYELAAEAVLGVLQSTDKLRGSVYSTAQEMAACLKNTFVTDWVNPRPGHDPRPQFHPDTFVTGAGTPIPSPRRVLAPQVLS